MAASIIRDDIRMTVYECDNYRTIKEVEKSEDLVPESLKCFLKGVLCSKGQDKASVDRRGTAIAQAIIASCRPRSFISPLLLAMAIYIHRKYASRELIEILSSLGFSANYREVQC